MRVLHVITGLWVGGAETMLFRVLSAMDRTRISPKVVSLTEEGFFGRKIKALGIPVVALNMSKGPLDIARVIRLMKLVRSERPDVVQTWMYHSDLFGGLAARVAGVPVIWGVHQSNLTSEVNKRTTLALIRVCAALSRSIPARILCTAEAAARAHAEMGYARDKIEVVPVGLDDKLFVPDTAARARWRREWDIPEDSILIGMAARLDPQKDHANFFSAAAKLLADRPNVRFVLCGRWIENENLELLALMSPKVFERSRLLGPWDDMPGFHNALDIATLSSCGEGFPTVLGEAMLCGVPVVATDVGDVEQIVGNTGRVVPPRNADALANGWRELVDMTPAARRELGGSARQRIQEKYSLGATVKRYEALYHELASDRNSA